VRARLALEVGDSGIGVAQKATGQIQHEIAVVWAGGRLHRSSTFKDVDPARG
jgi:hypothetical protein